MTQSVDDLVSQAQELFAAANNAAASSVSGQAEEAAPEQDGTPDA